jgi:hypothetical protein
MKKIKNIDRYNHRMSKSMLDKMYFLDKIDPDILVDFGCADGELISHILPYEKNSLIIGYDSNEKMIELAKARIKNSNIILTSKESFLDPTILKMFYRINDNTEQKTCLILSSVIHEIYSYLSPEEIEHFWEMFNQDWDYICIRDMFFSKESSYLKPFESDILKVRMKSEELKEKIKIDLLGSFEKIWGSIEDSKNFTHYLLKYRYDDNWEREVHENYFALYLDDLLKIIKGRLEYKMIYFKKYTLPYTKNMIKQDFGINLTDNTHVQFILSK